MTDEEKAIADENEAVIRAALAWDQACEGFVEREDGADMARWQHAHDALRAALLPVRVRRTP